MLQPNEEGPVETVVFEDTVALRTGRDSPISDCGSITVKEERIIVEDVELGPSQNKKKEKTQTSTPNKTSTQSNAIEEGETREASEKGPEETQAVISPTLQSSGDTEDDDNIEESGTEESDEAVEAGIRKSEEYKFFCKLCHIGFLKETSYKYHFANNIELHKKMKRTNGKVSLKDFTVNTIESLFLNSTSSSNRNGSVMIVERPFPPTSSSENTCTTITSWMIPSSARSAILFSRMSQPTSHIIGIENTQKTHKLNFRFPLSKLHLERRTKICYCRECEEIFTCKVEHQV